MKKKFNLAALIPLLIAVVIIIFFMRGLKENPRLLPSTLINKPAPAFHLQDLSSKQIWTENIFKGQYTIVVVWASWCETCKDEAKFLMQLHQQHPNIQLIGLNYKDNPAAAKAWLAKYGNPYHLVLQDTDGNAAINYGVYGTPESYLINPQGIIIAKHVGALDQAGWMQDFQSALEHVTSKKLA